MLYRISMMGSGDEVSAYVFMTSLCLSFKRSEESFFEKISLVVNVISLYCYFKNPIWVAKVR